MPRLTNTFKELPKVLNRAIQIETFIERVYNPLINQLNFVFRNLSINSNFDADIFTVTIDSGETERYSHKFLTVPAYRVILKAESTGTYSISDETWTETYVEFKNNGATSVKLTIALFKE